MKTGQKVALVTFGLFFFEAILHYNLGKEDAIKKEGNKKWLPPQKSLIRLAVIVGAFSFFKWCNNF